MSFSTQYDTKTNATLATVLTELQTDKIGPGRIIAIEYDGSAWWAIYTIQ